MGGFKYDVTELVEGLLDVLPFRWTWISGVEVTQSIQQFGAAHHLTDPAHQGSDNSVRLVANKPAWVRVYAQSRPERRVTASLEVERRVAVVRSLIEELPEGPEKETVRLFYLEGELSAREIADRLGLGKSAVTMRLERFRARVKRELLARLLAAEVE